MTLSRLSSVRSLSSILSPPIGSSMTVSIHRINPNRIYRPSLPLSLSLVVSKKAATTGRRQPSCRVEEKSDRDAQFTLVALTLRSRCRTNELTSAIHRIDRSGNGCARTDAITIRLGSCIDMEGLERSKIRERIRVYFLFVSFSI